MHALPHTKVRGDMAPGLCQCNLFRVIEAACAGFSDAGWWLVDAENPMQKFADALQDPLVMSATSRSLQRDT